MPDLNVNCTSVKYIWREMKEIFDIESEASTS